MLSRLHHRLEQERGATMVETSIGVLILLLLIFTTIDIFLVGYYNIAAQHVVSESVRKAIVGTNYNSAAELQADVVNQASVFGLPVDPSKVTVCAGAGGCGGGSLGQGSQLIIVTIDFDATSLFQGWDYKVRSTSIGRNEPF